MLEDKELLRRYAFDGSEAAFGELVERYVNLVHSAALRRTGGDASLAKDVAQLVFSDLAGKARWLPKDVILAGWLHRATRFSAANLLRAEHRRRTREQEAVEMNVLQPEPAPDWDQIRPVLDAALDHLDQTDRDALLLRFFERRSLAEIGQALGSTEDAARKRISRALDRLRGDMLRRGLTTTAAALSAVISANAVHAAPAGLAAMLTNAALAGTATGTGTTVAFVKLMAMTNLKLGLITVVVVAGIATPLVIQHHAQVVLREQDKALRQRSDQLAQLNAQNQLLSSLVAQTKGSSGFSDEQMSELLRLRGEVGRLRHQTNELARLREENQRLRGSLTASSADPNQSPHPPEYYQQLHQMAAGKEADLRSLGLAFHLYASDHGDQLPNSLDQITPYFAKENLSLTGTNEIDLFYQGSLGQLSNTPLGEVIVFRDREVWRGPEGKWTRVYGMADGSTETIESDDNFRSWEAEHTLPRASGSR
jgi:RNA polymerase sigma factor (sigma-70 family)